MPVMKINVNDGGWTNRKNMFPKDWVLATNGIDVEIVFAEIRFDYDKKDHYSHIEKKLPNGEITHWKSI
jgi:hypothetical protein